MTAHKFISRSTAALVVFLAISAAVLSYDALRALAADNGVAHSLDWLWPLTLDGFIIVASLSVLRNSLLGERTVYPWSLVITFSLASVVFNVAHAPDNLTGQAIAAVPPFALLLSFELLMSQLKSEVRRNAVLASLAELHAQADKERAKLADLQAKAAALAAKVETQQAALRELKAAKKDANGAITGASIENANAAKQAQIAERRTQVLQHLQAGLSKTDIAELLGVSADTVRRDAKALNGQLGGNDD